MKLEHAKKIVEHLQNEFGEDDARVYENYSGRCMFGRTTAGVVASSVGIIRQAMGELKLRFSVSQDNMGLDYIVY